MATKYKSGSWAKHGRVMPGCRAKPKVIDQILVDGEVVQTNDDQKFSPSEIGVILQDCFADCAVHEHRFWLMPLRKCGRGVCFYTRNVYHLGGDWGAEKKRIQIGADFPELYRSNLNKRIETILLGIYHYYPDGKDGVALFVCFSAATYAGRSTHNSAAHIHTIDLLNAVKNGVYRRIDRSGNELLVLDKMHFVEHVNGIRGVGGVDSVQKDRDLLAYLGKMFETMPKRFLGVDCYKEMMTASDKTRMRQSAWEGWYYEFYFRRYLQKHPNPNVIWWAKKGADELDFDLRFPYCDWFYGDVKSDAVNGAVQGNRKDSVDFLVREKDGRLWYIALGFTSEKDSEHDYVTTRWWNKQLGKVDRPMSYCSRMKYAIDVNRMDVYEINSDTIPYLKVIRPSDCNNRPRGLKYEIPHKMKEFLRIYERT